MWAVDHMPMRRLIRSVPIRRRWTSALALFMLLGAGCGQAAMDGASGSNQVYAEPDAGFFGRLFRTKAKPATNCEELGEWLAKHRQQLTAKAETQGFILAAEYRPAACMACMEEREALFTDATFQKRVAELKPTELFVLKFTERTGVPDSLRPSLDDSLAENLVEVVGGDTFNCAFLHIEATPSMLPYRTVLIGFERVQDDKDRQLVLLDRPGQWGGDVKLLFQPGGVKAFAAIAPDSLTTPSL